jgi:hypothetical protein
MKKSDANRFGPKKIKVGDAIKFTYHGDPFEGTVVQKLAAQMIVDVDDVPQFFLYSNQRQMEKLK